MVGAGVQTPHLECRVQYLHKVPERTGFNRYQVTASHDIETKSDVSEAEAYLGMRGNLAGRFEVIFALADELQDSGWDSDWLVDTSQQEWKLRLYNIKPSKINSSDLLGNISIFPLLPIDVLWEGEKWIQAGGKVLVRDPGKKSVRGEIVAEGPGSTVYVLLEGTDNPLCFPLHRLSPI